MNENVSKVMSANKGKDSEPELNLRKELWRRGLRGYRLHYKRIPGKPDITYVSKRLAIFVHGCYWHRCPYCSLPLPKSNREFWLSKFTTNIGRDRLKKKQLEKMNWKVLVFWECQLNNGLEKCIKKVINNFEWVKH